MSLQIIALVMVLFCSAASAKFTITNKQKSSSSLDQIVPIGQSMKLHLDHIYTVSNGNYLQEKQDLTQCPGSDGGCHASRNSDSEEADEIAESQNNIKKMLKKKEEKDEEKEQLRETKEKIEKSNKEMEEEHDRQELRKDTEQKLAKIKKSSRGVTKKLEQQKKQEDAKEAKEKLDKVTEKKEKDAKSAESEVKVKKMLDEGEKKADKKKEEVKQKSKEDEKKIEAAESITTPSGEKKPKPSVTVPTPPASEPMATITITPLGPIESNEGQETDQKQQIADKLAREAEKENKKEIKEEEKKTEEKKIKQEKKKELKKDPYKQSVDILNDAPFVNIRAGGDRGSIKGDDGDRKYSQKQFDVAVRMAAHDSAVSAIGKMEEVQKQDKDDQHQLKKALKKAEKGRKAVTVSSPRAVKSAIKEAVIKVSGNKKIAEPTLSSEYDKQAHKHSGPLYHAIQGIVDDPYSNGLNAATTAGISVAKQILDSSSGAMDNGMKDLSMTSRNMPPGITAAGFLDDESDD